MSRPLIVFLVFFIAPLAGGVATQLLFGAFAPGVLLCVASLGAVLMFKPEPLIDWIDGKLKEFPK